MEAWLKHSYLDRDAGRLEVPAPHTIAGARGTGLQPNISLMSVPAVALAALTPLILPTLVLLILCIMAP